MKEKKYLKIIYDLMHKENLTQEDIFEAFNYAERKAIAFSDHKHFLNFINEKNIYLFSQYEFNELAKKDEYSLLYGDFIVPKDIILNLLLNQKPHHIISKIHFKNFTDGDIKKLYNKYQDDSIQIEYMINMFFFIKDDKFKDEILKRLYDDDIFIASIFVDIVKTFKSDKYKLKWLNELPKPYQNEVIASLENDSKKIIHSLKLNKKSRLKTLSSIKNQELLKKIVSMPFIPKELITNINDEDVREKYFRHLLTSINRSTRGLIVASFSSREKQLELMSLLKSEKSRLSFIENSHVLTIDDILKIAENFKTDKSLIEIISIFNDDKITNNLVFKLKSKETITYALSKIKDLKVFEEILNRFSEAELKELMLSYDEKNINYKLVLMSKIKNKNLIFDEFETIELVPSNLTKIDYFCDLYAKEFNLNKDHLKTFVQRFGYGVFKYIKNKNIKTAINQNDEEFKKYMQLFSKENFTGNEISFKNALFALAQQEYKINNGLTINLFSNILHALDSNNNRELNWFLNQLVNTIGAYEELLKHYNIKDETGYFDFVAKLGEDLSLNRDATINFIHDLCGKVIDDERNYLTKCFAEVNFQSEIKKIKDNAIVELFIYYFGFEETKEILMNYFSYLTSGEQNFLKSERLKNAIDFKYNPHENANEEVKRDLKIFNSIVKKVNKIGKFDYKYPLTNLMNNVKEVDYDNNDNLEYIFSILKWINPRQLSETIFNNEDNYKELLDFLTRTKLLGNTPILKNASERSNIDVDELVISDLINNYSDIVQNMNDKDRRGLIDYLVSAEYYGSESNRYKNLFGSEVLKLIKSNPGPNSSVATKKERLTNALSILEKFFQRKYLTIPPQNVDYELSNGKKLNVKIGDLTNLNNLVLGEKTGSCMRIKGEGYDLMNFCLFNDTGFHMVFHDPKTNKIISRVSGFRNGNTVFFNQLRYSISKDYTNEDLKECMKKASEYIIEQTKNSEYPVENVFVSKGYAYEIPEVEPILLNVKNIKQGLTNFYSDINERNAIVVATTAKNSDYKDVLLNPKLPKYEALKSEITHYTFLEASEAVKHLETLKKFLAGENIEDIEVEEKECIEAYVTDTWAMYITNDNKFETICINDSEKSLTEIHDFLKKLKNNQKEMENTDAKREGKSI